MRSIARGFLLILIVFGLALSQAIASNRVALVVGNSSYANAPLANPVHDADIVSRALEAIGFDVSVRTDLDLVAFDRAVSEFSEKARGADIALFYFAGHGFAVRSGLRAENVLMSTSAQLTSASDLVLRAGGIPLEDVAQRLIVQAKATLIFVDACRNDPNLRRALGGTGRGLAPSDSLAGGSIYIGISTRLGETAEDGVGGQGSPFARAFAVAVQKPGVRIDDVFRQVRDSVRSETEGRQVPDVIQDDLPNGALTLVGGSGQQVAITIPAPPPPPIATPTRVNLPVETPLATPIFNSIIKIGVAGPITGPNASFGAQMTNGVSRAAEDINKTGGILGRKIVVEEGDDVSDPKQGVSVANKFVGDGVKLVVGHFNSGVTIPASEVYSDNGVLFITPSATNPKVTDRGLWDAFRTCGRDDQQGRLWADLALGKLRDKKIAILHDKTPYGKGLVDAAKAYMNAGGKKEVLYMGVNVGEKDYSAVISKIKESGAEYVMWGGLHTEGGLLVRQMRDQGLKTVMISGDGITDDEFAQIGGPGVEGTLMSFPPEPRNNPAAKDVLTEFKAKGFDPEGYTLYSYAAMQIFKQAAEAAGSLDTKRMSDIMHSGRRFHTVLGDIVFDNKGDRAPSDYVWYVWQKGSDGKITYHQT